MGRIANHACVFARLIIPNDDQSKNDYGVFPFMVQLREHTTHKHLKGIKTGDIGPKFGYVGKDNGFLQMDNVRIPRDNMF